jgi:O-antigen/teichoic acid export membrane protein
MPWVFGYLKRGNQATKVKLVRITYACFVAILSIAVVLASTSPWLLKPLVGEAFLPAARFLIWLALGQAFYGMCKMVATYLFYVQKTSTLGWIAVMTLASSVSLNYSLINAHGSIGAAEAFFGAYLLSFLLTWYRSSRSYPMPYLSAFRTRIR